jgi:hypothetical protein
MQARALSSALVYLSVTAGLVSLTATAAGQDCAQLVARQSRGPADAVFTRFGASYFGAGTELMIGDISDIQEPEIAGSVDLGMLIGDIVVEGDLALVAAGSFDGGPGALITVDVSDPALPTVVDVTEMPLPARSLARGDGVTYVGLADPVHPSNGLLLTIDDLRPDSTTTNPVAGWPEELNLDGDLLWVTELGTGARAFSVEEPAEPVEVGFVSGNVRDAAARDRVLYLAQRADDGDGLLILDVADPASPLELATHAAARPRRVEVFGPNAYLVSAPSESSVRLEVLDVSPPADVSRRGILSLGSDGGDLLINDLFVAASLVYLTHSQGGPTIIDTLDATEPRLSGDFRTPGLTLGLALDGNLLAMAGGSSGLAAADLGGDGSTLPSPGTPPLPFAQDVALTRGHAFVASWDDGVLIYDLADPELPELVATVDTGYRFTRVVASGDHLYATFLGDPYVTTAIIDISDPGQAEIVAELEGGVVAVEGEWAYADWSDWLGQCALATWNVSDPEQPGTEPSRINFWGNCARCDWPWPDYRRSYELEPHRSIAGVAICGNLAWVALGQGGLRVLSLEDPAAPTQVAALDVAACGITAAAARRGGAFVTTHSPSGVLRLGLDGAGGVVESGFVPLAGFPTDAVLSGETIFVTSQTAGVTAIDVAACTPPLRATGRRTP